MQFVQEIAFEAGLLEFGCDYHHFEEKYICDDTENLSKHQKLSKPHIGFISDLFCLLRGLAL